MSDETKQRLAGGTRVAADLRATADQEIEKCLTLVGSGLRGRLDQLAKDTAQSQPEVAKSLGSDGLKALRAELADAADALAQDLRSAAETIKWPKAVSEYTRVDVRKIHSALFEYLYGPRVNVLAAVFKRRGFNIRDGGINSQSFILPQSLYAEKDFEALARALNEVGAADRDAADAKAADDADVVSSLWDDSAS